MLWVRFSFSLIRKDRGVVSEVVWKKLPLAKTRALRLFCLGLKSDESLCRAKGILLKSASRVESVAGIESVVRAVCRGESYLCG